MYLDIVVIRFLLCKFLRKNRESKQSKEKKR